MANQTQIPLIHHEDPVVVQLQQNTNKVFLNLAGQSTQVQETVSAMFILGEVKTASVTLAQFQTVAGKNWVACDGASCVGTDYSKLTSNNVVPNIAPVGTVNSFILVNNA